MSDLDRKLGAFLDMGWYAKQLGATSIKRYNDELSQRTKGDVCLGGLGNVEEKANARDTDDCLLELIQAIEDPWEQRKTRGWFFDLHDCDYLLHGYFSGQDIVKVCVLRWKPLRDRVFELIRNGERPRTGWSTAGYGITLCMFVPYAKLRNGVLFAEWVAGEQELPF